MRLKLSPPELEATMKLGSGFFEVLEKIGISKERLKEVGKTALKSLGKDVVRKGADYLSKRMPVGAYQERMSQLINDEVKVLKENPRDNIKVVQMVHEKSYISNIIKPSIVSACENENIKFEIEENDDEEEEEEDEEEDDEEIVEPIKVKKEVIIIEDEELEEDVIEEEEDDVIEEDIIEAVVVADIKKEVEEEVEVEDEVETEASDEEDEDDEEEVSPAPTKVEKEEEEELEIITIDDIDYCTNDLENGFIWELNEDGEQGDKIGYLKEGEPFFYADEN